MDSSLVTLVAFGVVSLALVSYAVARDRRRRRAVERVGIAMGLRYERRSTAIARELSALPSIDGSARQIFSHVLRGGDEIVCDRTVVDPQRKTRRQRVHSIAAIRLPGADRPRFRLVSDDRRLSTRLWRPLAESVSEGEATLPSRARLYTDEPERTHAYFDRARRAAIDLPAGFVVEGCGDWILCAEGDRRLTADELPGFRERARAVSEQLSRDTR